MKRFRLVLACVHATNAIPSAYAKLFSSQASKKLLKTHWGFDPGALDVAKELKRRLNAPLHTFPVSRLLIEPDNYKPKNRWGVYAEPL
ncbi:hypothetical protein IT087_04475, partial [Candidatus Uhrbacteria bacterium]|nr:hypothetical protein [Candidatus Uhrbacteria bacterium]